MVPIGPDNSLMQQVVDLGNIDKYSTELSSEEKVIGLFPQPPSETHLHIVVQHPGIGPGEHCFIWVFSFMVNSSQKERLNESLLPSEGVLLCQTIAKQPILTLKQLIYVDFNLLCK
jgi:hypothetical protein